MGVGYSIDVDILICRADARLKGDRSPFNTNEGLPARGRCRVAAEGFRLPANSEFTNRTRILSRSHCPLPFPPSSASTMLSGVSSALSFTICRALKISCIL